MAEAIEAISSHQPGSENYRVMTAAAYYAGPAVRAIYNGPEGMAMTTMTYPPAAPRRVIGGVDTHNDVHVAAA
jgi:hypothetical protein